MYIYFVLYEIVWIESQKSTYLIKYNIFDVNGCYLSQKHALLLLLLAPRICKYRCIVICIRWNSCKHADIRIVNAWHITVIIINMHVENDSNNGNDILAHYYYRRINIYCTLSQAEKWIALSCKNTLYWIWNKVTMIM